MRAALAAGLCLFVAACGGTARPAGPDMKVVLAAKPAPMLADYGLFTDAGAQEPAERVTEYDLVNPLFTDHARKHRYVFTPEGEAATYGEPDVFEFPVGSVLVKTFAYAPDLRTPARSERFIETRLLIRKASGWTAQTYVWNADQTEARYAPVGAEIDIETVSPAGQPLSFTYDVPNQNQCKTCHGVDGRITPIGPAARNLNRVGPHGLDQLADWTARGLLSGLPVTLPTVADAANATLPVEARARAYLDINCAHCHREGGSASNSGLWLTIDEAHPARLGVSKYPTAAGRGSGQSIHVITPGQPEASILAYRMASSEPGTAMPELGRNLIDDEGVALVRAWIAEMD